ncbi:Very-long-chain 3-ketoacyl-CoA synthase [Trema orientale]|uniref:3-ketoacyl-CoA synthase n=1 Tax=Trema orientale TaxID=63057 RepID=A0A2P5ESG0_TREOI|nr:Very-long-chain 3-ketoacyl-CoA synthase [Trema orientale]
MAKDELEQLSAKITNNSSPNEHGSAHFTVKIRPTLPDFLTSVSLKYVKLGYGYLICRRFYLLVGPIFLVMFGAQIGNVLCQDLLSSKCDLRDAFFLVALLIVIVYLYFQYLAPRPTYLLDFACYSPPDDLKISKEEFIELARKSGNFSEASIDFQRRVLEKCGIGEESYMPRIVFQPNYKITLNDGREEAAMVIFGAINELFATAKIRPKDIGILVVNCGVLNTTPSLASMVINHFKLRNNVQSFNVGGMGCSAGIIAVDMAKDLLKAYPGAYALVVSTEVVSFTWYKGNDLDKLLPNCLFRMGAAAMLLSSSWRHRWRAKYELQQLLRTHHGMLDKSFRSVRVEEDAKGMQGVSVSKDATEALLLPVSQHLDLLSNQTKSTAFFEHLCIVATSKKVLDEMQRKLGLEEDHMKASRKTLERFGNTSSSSVWYELAYLESNSKIKSGDRIWQIAFGSGIKCNSVVWKALKNVGKPIRSPWN